MRIRKPKLGQIGKYWLSMKHKSWCRTWFDTKTRQTCRQSLETLDFEEASRRLAAFIAANERPKNARMEEILVEQPLLFYWNDKAQYLPSAYSIHHELKVWQDWWAGKTMAEVTQENLRLFREHRANLGHKKSTIDRLLSTGKAAFNYAVDHEILQIAPRIKMHETASEKAARPPLGRPLNIEEMARFIELDTPTPSPDLRSYPCKYDGAHISHP